MTTFGEFLPMDRRAALAGGENLPDRAYGTALFADISGFTPLTAALAGELGADRGAEELTRQLNRVFGALITQVHAYHGSVIGFSGDAISCWFAGDDGRRAATAALAMQHSLAGFERSGMPGALQPLGHGHEAPLQHEAPAPIGIKVSLAAGFGRRLLVGDPAISYIEVLAGSVLDRAAAGEKLAGQGQVIVGQEVREALGDDLAVRAERSGQGGQRFYVVEAVKKPAESIGWPEFPPLAANEARQWILEPVFERLELAEGQFVSELRQATALFMKFGGVDYDDDENAGQKLDGVVCWVQTTLERYGASLSQVTLGDKGSYLLSVFGAPIAHEDDTARALDAALELRTAPAYLDFVSDIKIGVNRGLIHAGTYGGAGRLTYGILGDATNVAARLMEQAQPGQVLTAARLANTAGEAFDFRQRGQVQLKGLRGPLAIASLEGLRISEKSARPQAGSVIGREEEKAALQAALRHLIAGDSQVLIIEGEAGIGKSSLVAELRARAGELDISVLEGAGDAVEQSTPYFAWRRIARQIVNANGTPDGTADAVLSNLEAADRDMMQLAPLLNMVLPLNMADNELTRDMSGEVRADNLNSLLAALLGERAASAPLTIVLEDAHWLDSASWSLARVAARDVSPLLLVIATRPPAETYPAGTQYPAGTRHPKGAQPSPDFDFLRRLPSSTVLTLDVLAPEEMLALVRKSLGADDLPQLVAQLVLDKAEGHPFFGEELAYALRDAGYLRVTDGRVQLQTTADELSLLSFPDTIQGVITSRIDRVSAQQQLILKVASVIGRIFAYQILHDIYPFESSDSALHADLAVLEKLDITPLEAPDPQLAYIFRHIIMQEVTYGLLTFAQRKRLHRAAAQWYEARETTELGSLYPLLAYHWTVAEQPEKAIPYALEAGRLALENGAFQEAIKHIESGLAQNETAAVVTDAAQLAEWRYLLGTAYRQVGQLASSFDNFSTALDLLKRPYPAGRARLTLGLLGQVSRQMLHRAAPGFFDGRADAVEQTLLVARICEGLQHVFFYRNDTIASIYVILRHLNLAEEAPPSAQRARSYGATVNVAGVAGLHRQADGYKRLAEEALQGDVSLPDRALVLEYLSLYLAGVGRWAENEDCCLRSAEMAMTVGNRRLWKEDISCLALTTLWKGEVARSLELRQQVLQAAVRDEDRQVQVWGYNELAEIALLHGDMDEAARLLAQAEAIAGNLGLTEQIWLNGLRAVTLLRLGDMDSAQSAVQKAQAAISAAPPSAFYLTEAISGMIAANMALWRLAPEDEERRKEAKKSIGLLIRYARSFPIARPRSFLWQGQAAWHTGKEEKGMKLWEKGLDAARALQMPYEEGLLLLATAEHLPAESNTRRERLGAARDLFEELNAVYDLTRLNEIEGRDRV